MSSLPDWFKAAGRPDVVRRSLKIALLVGTALVAINQGNHIVAGNLPADAVWKIPLTFVVPYLVSTYAAVEATLDRRDRR